MVNEDVIAEEIRRLRAEYQTRAGNSLFRALVYGHFGTGKTKLLATARAPIMVDSFDPHGLTSIRKNIESGRVIPVMFDHDDSKKPTEYMRWEASFEKRKRDGVFDKMGTYCIDSGTNFLTAAMNKIVYDKMGKRPDRVPAIQDYMVQQILVRDILMVSSTLPCDFIMTGHIDTTQDEVTGATISSLACPRGLKIAIPIMFSEVYVTRVITSSQGSEYKLLTQDDGVYRAETRIGGEVFEKLEDPDIKNLLKKAGLPYEDKEML